eukprot:PhF_6_TR37667/c0_g1_i4/m.56056
MRPVYIAILILLIVSLFIRRVSIWLSIVPQSPEDALYTRRRFHSIPIATNEPHDDIRDILNVHYSARIFTNASSGEKRLFEQSFANVYLQLPDRLEPEEAFKRCWAKHLRHAMVGQTLVFVCHPPDVYGPDEARRHQLDMNSPLEFTML